MSHFVNYACKVVNKEYLKRSLKELGFDYSEDEIIEDYYKKHRKVELAVVRNNTKLPIGWERNQETNELDLIADWFNTGINQNQFTQKISQLNSKYLIQDVCEEKGWFVDPDDIYVDEEQKIKVRGVQYA